MFDKEGLVCTEVILEDAEVAILEEVLNEEILSCLRSGYGTKNEYVVKIRSILKKMELHELYRFEEWDEDYEK